MSTHDLPTPSQALDALFNAAVGSIGGERAALLFNIVRAKMDGLEAERNRARMTAQVLFGDLYDLALACEMRDDECYRDAIERRLSEWADTIGFVRVWHERQELASLLDDAPRYAAKGGAK